MEHIWTSFLTFVLNRRLENQKPHNLHFILSLIRSHLYTKNYLQTYEQILYKPYNWSLPSHALAMSHPLGISSWLSLWWFCALYRDNLTFPSLPQYREDVIAGISVELLLIYTSTKLLLLSVLLLAQISRRGHGQDIVLFDTTLHHCRGRGGRRDPLSHFWEGRATFSGGTKHDGEPIAHCSLS